MADVVLVAITRPDGQVCIAQIIERASLGEFSPNVATGLGFKFYKSDKTWRRKVTEAVIDDFIAHTGSLDVSWPRRVLPDVPASRLFRDAWTLNERAVVVDMPKARDIHRDRLRTLRKPKLEALDMEYQRADEASDTKAKKAIAEKKQALRDVTADPAIEAAKTPEELAAVIPAALRG